MAVPVLLPTNVKDESFAGVRYHVEGELVPVLHIELADVPVFFEHHILLWKDPAVQIEIKPLKGMLKRMLAGMAVFMTETAGSGRIAFSRDGAGHVFGLHLNPGQAVDVREHQFLAATSSLNYSFMRVKGVSNMLLGGTGFFVDTFKCEDEPGILWLHGYGNVFEVNLKPGEELDIEPGAWIYKEPTVSMETIFQRLTTSFFGGSGQVVWNRFTGPGRLALQSMCVYLGTAE